MKYSSILTSLFFAVLIFTLFFFRIMTSNRMPVSYNYDADFGRDLLTMLRINKGKLTLIGPQLSLAGLHTAPYYFYFFAPFLRITNYNHNGVVYANAAMYLLGFLFLLLYVKKTHETWTSLLLLLWLVTTPYVILAARTPGNAFSYVIILFWYIAILFRTVEMTPLKSILFGITAGIVANFHPISLIPLMVSFFLTVFTLKKLELKTKLFIFSLYIFTFIITFLPVLIFEFRHNFVIWQNLKNPIRIREFFGNNGYLSTFSVSNIFTIDSSSVQWLPLGLISSLFILILLACYGKNKDKFIWIITTIFSISFFLLNKGSPHYYFPVLVLIQCVIAGLIMKITYARLILIFFIILNIYFFPKSIYQPGRNLIDVENKFNQYLKLQNLPKINLNVILINDTHLSIVGYEYRFLLEKYNYPLQDEYSYNKSDYLLLISEKGEIDWQHLTSWELNEFGQKVLLNKYVGDKNVYYLFGKI
ncbi:hypothetical protein A2960_03645 [Candidatus Gottesmanbacteria bacterium RIFCSPLOWO2_01_FULL_39_12b]|uniref:Glycosyltransferase RgtA/B/C/D-like domain-containing protein n=1 Tax=Candidatus Gottesmanbacteria bacterium RIFCSPLOWO2_01_FULL_39_12b TaxID=1798388 RepID=A0A1F6ANY2_9BACT|nr:MAG: hypothetical protein A2960_03645 [Candidatus Gottesmanbacteria bacterium RIFCSPLOWO2_01_FULL_39_12b]